MAERTEPSLENILRTWGEGKIAVISDPKTLTLRTLNPNIFIDAVMAKENTGTTVRDAPLVIALGPGFVAGKECHMVVETNPDGMRLGKVILSGEADRNTRKPTSVMG